jgi:quinol monooxygenase YgiN
MSDTTDEPREGPERTAADEGAHPGAHDVELTVVTMRFDASDDEALLAVLSKYVVLTRMEDGCRNVDLVSSVTRPGRHLVIQKWDSPEHQRRHFDTEVMVEMATACTGILSGPPDIDLWEGTSAHDLA